MRLHCRKCGKPASNIMAIDIPIEASIKAGTEIYCERCARERQEIIANLKKMAEVINENLKKLLTLTREGEK